jgi:hypothetical protein
VTVHTITSPDGLVEPLDAARFLARSRWRCRRCDSPWYAASDTARAWERLRAHIKGGC